MLALWLALAGATVPLPDYGHALADARWYAVDKVLSNGCAFDPEAAAIACEDGTTALAREMAEDFQRIVTPSAGLTYLVGLSYRYDGDADQASIWYERAIELDPTYEAAWYDLGELHLIAGRFAAAAQAFEKVSELVPEGDTAWVGPWRRAEVAAHQKQPEVFETWMKTALERGFSFRAIEGSPPWRGFYADPMMRDSIEKLITVYGTPQTLDTLR
jgi:tetratricopeptide (TPR) repeat protein